MKKLKYLILLFLTTIDRIISLSGNEWNILSIIIIHLTLILSIVEIIVFIKLYSFNKGNYNKFIKSNLNKHYKLNSRYQQLENVYTGNQLTPSFIFHFLNILGSNLVCIGTNYIKLNNDSFNILIATIFILHAIAKLGTELTLIIFHPILRKKLFKIILKLSKYIKCLNNIKVENEFNIKMTNNSKEQNLHFEMLKEAWK
ncbi:hypothetical protein Mgra_00007163 [Meloidogyne graminicola]|uniref:Uncharacterized protein n=1 Tax=Meloidogyne graminicola TaxID=189291 RepID=A0A8S9ZJV9_9BILA|nr:hypothetical protein Mgra_00007163 [Meloidogyne graminicola]